MSSKLILVKRYKKDKMVCSYPYPYLCKQIDTDYVCFTDDTNLKSKFWDVRYLENLDSEEVSKAVSCYDNVLEILPNQILTDTVFLDGGINEDAVITVPSLDEIKDISFDKSRLVPTSDEVGNYLFTRNPVYTDGKYNGREFLLTIGVPVSNQIDTIERCLSHVKLLLDELKAELLVIDTGSADGTIEVCKSFGARVIDFPWCDNMSAVRNAGIYHAMGEWYLSIDDDEWFENVDEILDFFKSGDYHRYDAATYIQRKYNTSDGRTYSDNQTLRMARITPELHFEGRIHDAMMIPQDTRIYAFSSYAHHYGFRKDDRQKAKQKYLRNVPYLLYDLYEYPDNLRYNFQLAKELNAVEEYGQAIAFFFRGMAIEKEFPDAYFGKNHAIYLLAALYNASDRRLFQLAKALSNEYIFSSAEKAFIAYIYADMGFGFLDAEEIIHYYDEYLKYKKMFEETPADSLRLNTVGLEVCTNTCYAAEMQVVIFCVYCERKNFERALTLLKEIEMEHIANHAEDFCRYFWRVPEEVAEEMLKKMGSVFTELWLNKLLNAFFQYIETGIIGLDRLSRFLKQCSIQGIEGYFRKNGNSIDEKLCEQLCELLVSFRADGLSVQELYFYSYFFKWQYSQEQDETKHIGYFCQYISMTGAFASMYYTHSVLEDENDYVVSGDVKAAYYLSKSLEESELNEIVIRNMRKALAKFPGFRKEIQILLGILQNK